MKPLDLLNEAIDYHLVEDTKSALALGANPNTPCISGRAEQPVPALGRALIEEQLSGQRVPMGLFRALVEGGANVHATFGAQLFRLAALERGDVATVHALFDAGFRPGNDHACLFTLHQTVLACLVEEQGMNLNRDIDRRGTPLLHAVRFERMDLLRYMLDHGANIEGSDYAGNTALLVACECQATDIIEFLLARGANARVANFYGETPLHLIDDTQAAEALIRAGAPLDAVCDTGHLPGDRRTPATKSAIEAWQLHQGRQPLPASTPTSRRL